MSSNDDTIIDVKTLALDDTIDAYEKLAKSYRQLKETHDKLLQKNHQELLQRKIYENSLNDLQSELDVLNEVHASKVSQIEEKGEELKNRNQKLIMENLELENKIEDMNCLIRALQDECTELKTAVLEKKLKPRYSDIYSKSLELENESLRNKNQELDNQLKELTNIIEANQALIEELKENVNCMRDNFESKKSELEEKNETIEQLQDKMHELSSELALLKNSDGFDDNNRKGNSLFAEVDDQRQKMKKILQAERCHYSEMKKAVNAREMEIRRLRRENLNIKSEIEACSRLLKRGQQMSSEHTRIYIAQLEFDKKNLEQELREVKEQLIDQFKEKKMHWVESVLTTTTKESRDLKDKNYVLLREKTLLADNHSQTLQDLSKSRLESIKLKVLLGRIVDEHKIKVNVQQFADIGVDREVLENLKLEDCELNSEFSEENEEAKSAEVSVDEGMLNESTIVLLGGRERLGFAIPTAVKHESTTFKEEIVQDKENIPAIVPVKLEPQETEVVPLKEKSVQFSNEIKTKVIDSTKEEFEVSQQARQKKPAFTIKRIIIPSKTKSKHIDKN